MVKGVEWVEYKLAWRLDERPTSVREMEEGGREARVGSEGGKLK